ncbi:Cytochrome b-c1 complex subunit 8 [Glycine soja]
MGKQIVPVKSVIYALSPFQQKIMPGLWKDLPTKIHHKVSENWISATLLLGPLVGTYTATLHHPSRKIVISTTLVCSELPGKGEAVSQPPNNVTLLKLALPFGLEMSEFELFKLRQCLLMTLCCASMRHAAFSMLVL